MPKSKNEVKKRPKKEPDVVLIRLPGRGKIDPRLIRKAVIEVRDRRLKEEAEAKANAEGNGRAHLAEVE